MDETETIGTVDAWFNQRPKDMWYVLTPRVDEDGDRVLNYRGGMDKATAKYVQGQNVGAVLGYGVPFIGM